MPLDHESLKSPAPPLCQHKTGPAEEPLHVRRLCVDGYQQSGRQLLCKHAWKGMLMSLFHPPIVQIIEELNASNDIIIWSVTVMWMNLGILI